MTMNTLTMLISKPGDSATVVVRGDMLLVNAVFAIINAIIVGKLDTYRWYIVEKIRRTLTSRADQRQLV